MAVLSAQTSLERVGEWAKEMRIYGGPVSTDISGGSRTMGEGNENLVYPPLWDFKSSLTCRKILRHGTSGFTSHP
jgi:hypothetical protein